MTPMSQGREGDTGRTRQHIAEAASDLMNTATTDFNHKTSGFDAGVSPNQFSADTEVETRTAILLPESGGVE